MAAGRPSGETSGAVAAGIGGMSGAAGGMSGAAAAETGIGIETGIEIGPTGTGGMGVTAAVTTAAVTAAGAAAGRPLPPGGPL